MKLSHNCPKCGKPAKIQAEFKVGKLINYVYQCGHLELREKITTEDENTNINSNINVTPNTSPAEVDLSPCPEPTHKELYDDLDAWVSDGGAVKGVADSWVKDLKPSLHKSFYGTDLKKKAYPYQVDGVKFAESAELNCILADAMGVGKTIEGLIAIKRNHAVTYPCLVVVKGATVFQWAKEHNEWVSKDFTSCMPVVKRAHIIPGFNFYIISMDMLAKKDVVDKLIGLNLKSILIDECQNFNNPTALRTQGLVRLIKSSGINYKIALSGTPIKNRLGEYGVMLNLIAPLYFPNSTLERYWFKPEEKLTSTGKLTTVYNRLNPLYADRWRELTSRFILRRERHDVLKDLPPLTRDYQIIEIDDVNIKNSYNRTVDLFKNYLSDNKTGINSTQLLGWLAQLRAITGQAKCKNAIEWTRDFMESSDEPLAIGIQHHSVRDTLHIIFDQFGLRPLKFSGEDNIYQKSDIIRRFTNGDNRLLVINMLAGGVGLNLQNCANALIIERLWSSADEEQFEARFHRDGQQTAVTMTYMLAKGTIDEFFHDLVIKKRNLLVEAGIGKDFDLTNDMASLIEFSEMVANHKI